MEPRSFVCKGYVCYNEGTTVAQYIDRCRLWGRRYYRYPGWNVDPRGTSFDNVNRIRSSGGNYNTNTNNGPPPRGNGRNSGGNEPHIIRCKLIYDLRLEGGTSGRKNQTTMIYHQ